MTTEVPIPLRAATAVLAASGVTVLEVTGLLPAAGAVGAVVLLTAAAAAPVLGVPRAVRQLAAAVVITAGALLALGARADGGAVDLADTLVQLGQLLAPLTTGVLIGQLAIADRVRDVRVVLVLSGMAFLLAVGLHPRPAVALPLLVGWGALVVACHEAHLAQRRERATLVAQVDGPRPPRRWRHLAVLAGVATVVAILFAALMPPPGDPMRNRFAGVTGPTGTAVRSAQAYSSGVLDLRVRGTLPDTPVAELPADSPPLWRGVVLTQYDGTSWRGPRGGAWKNGGRPDGPEVESRDEVLIREGFPGVLISPGRATDVRVTGRVQDVPGGYLLRGVDDRLYPDRYVVTSVRPSAEAADLRRPSSEPDLVPDADTMGLPADLPSRVRALAARVTEGAPTRYDAVVAVERFLAGRATYDLGSPVPPVGQDAVDHFLFDARTGFCEHFASAEVVLLRAVGIPARLVTGFAGGEPTDGGDRRLVRAKHAHAWVEVWYPGAGWVESDPTAGARLADSSEPLLAQVEALLRKAEDRALRVVVVLLLGTGAGGGLWWLLRRRRARRPALLQPAPTSAVLAAFRRLETALQRAGMPRGAAESVSELGRRLPADPRLTDALAVLEQSCYAGRQPAVTQVQTAADVLDDLAARVLTEQAAAAGRR